MMIPHEKTFKVNWDKPARVVTWFCLAVLLLALVLCVYAAITQPGSMALYIGLALLILLVPFYFGLQSPKSIVLTDDALVVRKVVGNATIPYRAIRSCALLRTYSAVRVFASGGFLGYVGVFWNRALGWHKVLAGSLRQPVCLNLFSGKPYILSCSDNQELLEALKNLAGKR